MKTKPWAIGLVVFCTIVIAFAQVLYKMGSDRLAFGSVIALLTSVITNIPLISGMLLYLAGAVILLYALKGGELSVLYPIIALNYVWVSILSMVFFNDVINPAKWAGVAFIILGVSFIGFGSKLTVPVTQK